MNKCLSFIAVLLLSAMHGAAQTKYTTPPEEFVNFHKEVSDAERMYRNDSALQAYAKFDLAFTGYKGGINPSHYIDAAMVSLKIKEEYKALHYLEKALTNGYELDSIQKAKITFFNLNTKKEYSDNLAKWEEAGQAKKNTDYENTVYGMQESTKKFSTPSYKTAIEYCVTCLKNKACNKTSPEFTSKYRLVKEKMKSDSVNANTLFGYIKQYGFPDYSLMDGKACAIARAVLLNYDADRKNERLDDILYKAMIKGQISPSFYAQVIDHRNLMNGLAPEFYEPVAGYEKAIKTEMGPANLRRKKIGLHAIILPNPAALKGVDPKDTKAMEKLYIKIYDY